MPKDEDRQTVSQEDEPHRFTRIVYRTLSTHTHMQQSCVRVHVDG